MSADSPTPQPTPIEPNLPAEKWRAKAFVYNEHSHWSLLILSSIVIALSFLMSTKGEEKVMIPVLNRPLPPLCMFKRHLKIDCPGCGLTRCFISLAHGDVAQAWKYNPAGLWFFVLVAAQIPYRAVQIWRLRTGREPVRINGLNWTVWVLLVLILGQWIVKLTLDVPHR